MACGSFSIDVRGVEAVEDEAFLLVEVSRASSGSPGSVPGGTAAAPRTDSVLGVRQQSYGPARRERACDGWRRAWCWRIGATRAGTGETRNTGNKGTLGQGNKADAECVDEMLRAEQATGKHTDYIHLRCARQYPGTHTHGFCSGLTLRVHTQSPSGLAL